MKLPFQIPIQYIIIAVAAIIIAATATAILLGDDEEKERDTTPPTLEVITKNKAVDEGDTLTIEVNFSDNVNVTEATLFYKKQDDTAFLNKSILSKTAPLQFPEGDWDDWEYYVTVNDAAGNGPVGDPSNNGSSTYKITVIKKDNGNDPSDNETKPRYIFVEEGTAESCGNCPDVADYLHELAEEGNLNFYYVSLINEHPEGKERMDELNVNAHPVVFIDGGYQAFRGRKDKEVYENAIRNALERETADVIVDLTAIKKENDTDISISVNISNNEDSEYKGTLRVYLAEIVSTKYQDFDTNNYKHAFLEFAIDKSITISAKSYKIETETIDGNEFDPDNLLIYAVLFSNEKHENFQKPETEEYPFDAYYVDGCDGAQIVEGGNLPPQIGIVEPKVGLLHLNSKVLIEKWHFQIEYSTILLGKTTFVVEAKDLETSVEKIELYIDDVKVQEFSETSFEYEYSNEKLFKFRHTIRFVAYDTEGKTASAEMKILAFTL